MSALKHRRRGPKWPTLGANLLFETSEAQVRSGSTADWQLLAPRDAVADILEARTALTTTLSRYFVLKRERLVAAPNATSSVAVSDSNGERSAKSPRRSRPAQPPLAGAGEPGPGTRDAKAGAPSDRGSRRRDRDPNICGWASYVGPDRGTSAHDPNAGRPRRNDPGGTLWATGDDAPPSACAHRLRNWRAQDSAGLARRQRAHFQRTCSRWLRRIARLKS